MSQVDLAATAPTQFQNIGGVSLAYRRFGKEGAAPVVCFQHFTGTINNFDPIHTNRLAQDRPVILIRPGVIQCTVEPSYQLNANFEIATIPFGLY